MNIQTRKKIIGKKQQYFTLASMSALLTACGSAATPSPTPTPALTNVTGDITTGNDVIKLGDAGGVGIVDALAGDDKITGGDKADFIRGNAGADDINGGAGVDNIVVIGSTSNAGYTLSDIQNPNGTGIDLSSLINLSDLNNNAISDIQVGEIIDGGADGAILFVYGTADFTGATLSNITRIDIHSEATFTAAQIKKMIDDGTLKSIIGDGSTKLIITNDGTAIELDFSGIDMQDVNQLTIPAGVTMLLDQGDLKGMSQIIGAGNLKAVSGTLDVNNIAFGSGIKIYDASGNLIVKPVISGPEFSSTSLLGFNVAEDSSIVGIVAASDGDDDAISYAIVPTADGDLFYINKTSGDVSFKAAPDFENPTDLNGDNVYNIIITATTADGLNSSRNVAITVINGNDGPTGSVNIGSNATQGVALTANTSSLADIDGLGILHYQWKSGTDNVGTDSDAYSPVMDDWNKAITVVVTYLDGNGTTESVTSNANTVQAALPLSSLDGTIGFKLNGVATGDRSGRIVSSAGDVNGDGFDDLIIGADYASPHGSHSGSSYVVFGKAGGFTDSIELSGLNGTDGFKLNGAAANDLSGFSVSSAGDVNGDGFDDLIIGAWGADPNGKTFAGSSYVVFGHAGGFTPTIELSGLNGSDGFKVNGQVVGEGSGYSVSSAGDVNGDGFDDLLIGADYSSPNGKTASGSSYVVFGKAGGFTPNVELSSINGTNGFRINGEVISDHSGESVSSAGDVNGDGFDDLIIGAYQANNSAGASYVVFGHAGGFTANIELSSLNGTNGFELISEAGFDQMGNLVSSAGDVNGDGFDDLIIGAYGANRSYVVFGKASGFTADVNLSNLNGTNGFKVNGVAGGGRSGRSVSSAGDVNGDGFDDLLIGADYSSPNGSASGSSYVVFGKASGFTASIELSSLNGTNGFRLDGVANLDQSGRAVSSAGDVNGDGFDDLIIGAHNADPNGNSNSGSSYVVFGGAQFAGTVHAVSIGNNTVLGTSGVDTLNGTAAGDVINAGSGVDTITGGAGNDNIWGGGGLDTFIFAAGDSTITIAGSGNTGTVKGYDVIHDFTVGNGNFNSETFNTVGTASVLSDGITDGTDSILTIAGIEIKSHSISNGVVSFDDADTYATALEISTEASIAAVLQYLQANDLGNAGTTVAFDVGADSFVFTQGDDAGTDNLDVIVRLEDVQIDSLVTANGTGAFDLFIV